MATRFGNFKELSQGKKPITADEAYLMLKELGMLGNQFIPGAESIGMLLDGKSPKEAAMALQDWIPGNAAYQNWLNDKPQDWTRNAVDAAAVGIPLAKPAGKALKKGAELVERIPKGSKEGYIDFKRIANDERRTIPTSAAKNKNLNVENFLKTHSGVIQKPKNWEQLGEEGRARYLATQIQKGKFFPHSSTGEMYYKTNPNVLDAHDYAEFMNYIEHRPDLASSLAVGDFNTEAFNKFIAGETPAYSDKALTNVDVTYLNAKRLLEPDKAEAEQRAYAAERKMERKAQEDLKLAEKKAKEEAKWAEKQAKWRAEREAQAKLAEERRLAKEAEEKRLAEEAEQKRLAEEAEAERIAKEEAERKAQEEEFERQFREEEAYERNRYADSVGTALGNEAVDRDIDNWLFDKLVEAESKAKPEPITTMDVFTGESFGNTPTVGGNAVQSTGKTRPSYDHSREFNGGSFQKLAPINRSELKGNGDLGERIFDAQSRFFTPYSKPGEVLDKMSNGRFTSRPYSRSLVNDPYHEAGIINDENVKLNQIIDFERSKGKTDAEIYRDHKKEFDNYQGMLERYKTRLNNPEAQFKYDDALTNYIAATPSEEINVLRKLGMIDDIDPKMAGYMDDISDHYKGLTKRIFDYESKFPRSPKLTSAQFKQLKDMGVKPEDIDIYLADHPEFFMQ